MRQRSPDVVTRDARSIDAMRTLPGQHVPASALHSRQECVAHASCKAIVALAAAATCLMCAAGCDSAARGMQRIELTVLDAQTMEPVQRARVVCGPAQRYDPSRNLSDDEYLAQQDNGATTDAHGQAELAVPTCTVRGGVVVWLGIKPVRLEDEVTGRTYLFGIRTEQNEWEILRTPVEPGTMVTGKQFALKVEGIGPPEEEID